MAQDLEECPGRALHVAPVRTAVLGVVAPAQQLGGRGPVVLLLRLGDPAALGAHRRPRDLDRLVAVDHQRRRLLRAVVLERVLGRVQVGGADLLLVLVLILLGLAEQIEVDLGRRSVAIVVRVRCSVLAERDRDLRIVVAGEVRGRPAVADLRALGSAAHSARRAGQLAGRLLRPPTRLGAGADQADERASAEQQDPADDEQHGDDVRADTLEEGGRRPVEGLAEDASMGGHEVRFEVDASTHRRVGSQPRGSGREREEQSGDEQQRAGVDRSRVGDERAHDQCEADPGEEHRERVGDGADGPRQGHLDPRAGRTPVPARVEDEPEVEAEGEQAESDQVEMALLELTPGGGLARRGLLLRGLARGGPLAPLAGGAAAARALAHERDGWHLAASFDATARTPAQAGYPAARGLSRRRIRSLDLGA